MSDDNQDTKGAKRLARSAHALAGALRLPDEPPLPDVEDLDALAYQLDTLTEMVGGDPQEALRQFHEKGEAAEKARPSKLRRGLRAALKGALKAKGINPGAIEEVLAALRGDVDQDGERSLLAGLDRSFLVDELMFEALGPCTLARTEALRTLAMCVLVSGGVNPSLRADLCAPGKREQFLIDLLAGYQEGATDAR